jgi:hypothetical protein
VITLVGERDAIQEAAIRGVGKACRHLIRASLATLPASRKTDKSFRSRGRS